MKLSLEQIRAITCGAVRVTQEEEGIRFYRFTREQEHLYRDSQRQTDKNDLYEKTFSTSNIRLAFRTNSARLSLEILTRKATTRKFFDLEVLVDGRCIGTINNHKDIPFPTGDPRIKCPLGEFQKEFSLGQGEKLVELHLPWSVCTALTSLTLEEGSFVTPVKRPKTLLIYGDSITQGYDVHSISRHYTNRLAEALQADPVSKAIGGEIFFPALAELKDDLDPDYITVSYGSNDFSKTDGSAFDADCKAFYTALRKHYPNAKIFALTPIWRADENKETAFGPFHTVEQRIRAAVADIPDVTVIRGYDFVPHDTELFSDLRLHPNDEGFEYFFQNLWKELQKAL